MMNEVRHEILKAIERSPNRVLSGSDIVNEVSGDARSITASLQGMSSEGTLEEHALMGVTYWEIADHVNIDLAARRTSEQEIAEQAIRDSAVFGDPQEARQSEDYDRLMRELL